MYVTTNYRPWTKIYKDGTYEVNISCERQYIEEQHMSLMFTGTFDEVRFLMEEEGASSFFQELLKFEGQEFPFTRMDVLYVPHLVTVRGDVVTSILVARPYWGEWKFVPGRMQGLRDIKRQVWKEYLAGLEGMWMDELLVRQNGWPTVKKLERLRSKLPRYLGERQGQFFKGHGFTTVTVGTHITVYQHPKKELCVTDSPEYGVAARVFIDLELAKDYAKGVIKSSDVKDDCIRVPHNPGWEQKLLQTIDQM